MNHRKHLLIDQYSKNIVTTNVIFSRSTGLKNNNTFSPGEAMMPMPPGMKPRQGESSPTGKGKDIGNIIEEPHRGVERWN